MKILIQVKFLGNLRVVTVNEGELAKLFEGIWPGTPEGVPGIVSVLANVSMEYAKALFCEI